MEDLKVGIIQFDIIWQNSLRNLEVLEDILNNSGQMDLLILPEMFNTGFSMHPELIAEDEDGPALRWMLKTSVSLNTVIVGSIAIKDNGRFYNRCFVVENGVVVSRYDKHNLFTMAGEEKVYTRGMSTVHFELKGWKVKPLICYDLRFPIWCYNEEEADLILFVANWPSARIEHWSSLLKARAIENQAFVIGVNRVGMDGTGKDHNGYSSIIGPLGDIRSEHISDQGLFISIISREDVASFRSLFNVLKDKKSNEEMQ